MFVQSLFRYAFLIGLLFVLKNGFCQTKLELPSELLHLAGMLSKPVTDLNNDVERPISYSDIPAITFRRYETGFFMLKKPENLHLFGSEIQKIMISVREDSTVNGIFVSLTKNDALMVIASEKLGVESGKWSYESSFGSSKDFPQDSKHTWNIGNYIISIFNSNEYHRTPADDKDRYVLTLRRKATVLNR